jgi:hypothetical protein
VDDAEKGTPAGRATADRPAMGISIRVLRKNGIRWRNSPLENIFVIGSGVAFYLIQ